MGSLEEREPLLRKADGKNSSGLRRWCPQSSIIELPLFIVSLATSALGTLMDQLVRQLIIGENGDGNDGLIKAPVYGCVSQNSTNITSRTDDENNIQTDTILWLTYLKIASSVPAVFATLIICSLTDSNGRKIGICLSVFGITIKVMIFTVTVYLKLNMFFLLLGGLVEGCTGGSLTLLACTFAYIADSSEYDRTIRFVFAQSVLVIAAGIAQVSTGHLINDFGFGITLIIMTTLSAISLLFTLAFIKDSKPPEGPPVSTLTRRRSSLQLVRDEVIKAVGTLKVFTKKHEIQENRKKLIILLLAFLSVAVVTLGRSSVETLFLLSPPLCLDSILIGYFNALTYIANGVVGFLGTWFFKKCLADIYIAILAALSCTISRVIFAFSTNVYYLILVILSSSASLTVFPMIRALMSYLIPVTQQGTLFAALFSLETVCDTVSGVMLNAVYGATVDTFPGLTFILMGAVYTVTTFLLCVYKCLEFYYKQPRLTLYEDIPNEEGGVIPKENSLKKVFSAPELSYKSKHRKSISTPVDPLNRIAEGSDEY